MYEFMRPELISSKKMKLGWESVQVSRFWSVPEGVHSQSAAGTKPKTAGNSLVIFFCFFFFDPRIFFSDSRYQALLTDPFALSRPSYYVL